MINKQELNKTITELKQDILRDFKRKNKTERYDLFSKSEKYKRKHNDKQHTGIV
jgi:hypothetical protein